MPKEITQVAIMFCGIAFLALLVSNAKGTSNAVQGAGMGFAGLLKTVTLQTKG